MDVDDDDIDDEACGKRAVGVVKGRTELLGGGGTDGLGCESPRPGFRVYTLALSVNP